MTVSLNHAVVLQVIWILIPKDTMIKHSQVQYYGCGFCLWYLASKHVKNGKTLLDHQIVVTS